MRRTDEAVTNAAACTNLPDADQPGKQQSNLSEQLSLSSRLRQTQFEAEDPGKEGDNRHGLQGISLSMGAT